jgi:hypothetical protein
MGYEEPTCCLTQRLPFASIKTQLDESGHSAGFDLHVFDEGSLVVPRQTCYEIRTFSLALVVALLLLGRSRAFPNPAISTFSKNSVLISSARVVRPLGGGSYVTGMIEPTFGYVPVSSAHACGSLR